MHISPAPRASGPQGPARDAKSEKLQTCFFCVVWLKCNNNRCFSVCALYVVVRMHLYVYIYIYIRGPTRRNILIHIHITIVIHIT